MSWQEASEQDKIDFISHVKDPQLTGLFDVEYCKLFQKNHDFYKNGIHFSLQNFSVSPPFTMDYFQSGETVVYLDGCTEPFQILNQHGCLTINEANIVDYLEFYCRCVNQRPKNILLLRNPDDLPYQDTVYIDFHFDKNNYGEDDIHVKRNEENNGYIIEAPFVFAGKIDPSIANISDLGEVHIERAHNR